MRDNYSYLYVENLTCSVRNIVIKDSKNLIKHFLKNLKTQ